jgi:chaperonin GroEL
MLSKKNRSLAMSTNPKELVFEEEARSKLFEGIRLLFDTISLTLGPKGRNVGFESWKTPQITNDGYQIANEIEFKDPFINMGASLAKEALHKIKETCGDGSTSGIVLLHALVEEGMKSLGVGHNPILMKRGMEKALLAILNHLDQTAVPIESQEEIKNIATVAASGNEEVGKNIQEAFKKVGKDGGILIEEAKGCDSQVEISDGLELDRGYISAYFCTNQEKLSIEMNHPYFLITDKKISSIQEILEILQAVAASGKELVILAEDIENDALATLVINKLKGILKVAALKAPSFGEERKALLEDLAILTGATFISEEKGFSLQKVSLDQLGSAEKVVVTKDKSLISGGKGTKKAIENRIAQIDHEIKKSSSHEKSSLIKRKGKLSSGLALIKVGAHSEVELKSLKQLYEDSLNSTRSALEEGVVVGGGMALLRAKEACTNLILEKEEKLGADILFRALEAPAKQILQNAALESSLLLHSLLKEKATMGFNVVSEKMEDFLLTRILDPLKVVKTSLKLAVSIATLVLTSEVLLADAKEPK